MDVQALGSATGDYCIGWLPLQGSPSLQGVKWSIGVMPKTVRKPMPSEEYEKVVDSNSSAGKGFFHEISVKRNFYEVDFSLTNCVNCKNVSIVSYFISANELKI